MSAFQLSKEHIHVLVAAGIPGGRYGTVSVRIPGDMEAAIQARVRDMGVECGDDVEVRVAENAEKIGQLLADENAVSVGYLYSDPTTEAVVYGAHRSPARRYSAVEVIKACDCFVYQSCEHPGWGKSLAKLIVHAIRERAISELPGYQEADWGIEDPA